MHPPSTSPVQVVLGDLSQNEESVSGDGGPCTSIPLRMLAGSHVCFALHTVFNKLDVWPVAGLCATASGPCPLDADTLFLLPKALPKSETISGASRTWCTVRQSSKHYDQHQRFSACQLCCRPNAVKNKGRYVGRCFRWLRVRSPSQAAPSVQNLTAVKS